jgi:hypothetical protein
MLFLALLFSCKDKEKIIVEVDEVPDDIFQIPLCETLTPTVMSMFRESNDNKEKYPQLFSNTVQQQIVLTQETEVFVSYVTEGAAIPSTLGWYSYASANTPGSSGDIDKKIVFPNVSNAILTPGDSRSLGRFPAGTVIGFYLIAGGFNNDRVNYSKPTFYTTFQWNTNQNRQHVLFKEKQCNNIVVGFEDKTLDGGSADADYNDIIFIVSDNDQNQATTSFNLQEVVVL